MEIVAMIGILLGVLIFAALCYILVALRKIIAGLHAIRKDIESPRHA